MKMTFNYPQTEKVKGPEVPLFSVKNATEIIVGEFFNVIDVSAGTAIIINDIAIINDFSSTPDLIGVGLNMLTAYIYYQTTSVGPFSKSRKPLNSWDWKRKSAVLHHVHLQVDINPVTKKLSAVEVKWDV